MSVILRLNANVGVAPGTTTIAFDYPAPGPSLGRVWDPYQDLIALNGGTPRVGTNARIRWDLIGLVGGGAFLVAMTASLIANALSPSR